MRHRKLTCEKARSICIVETLAKLGHFPSRTTEKEAWFLSPLRSETQASFKVSFRLNRWYDFGIGKGGNVIDLVCELSNCSVADALQFLSDELHIFRAPVNHQLKLESDTSNTILKVNTITKSNLKKYVWSRCISLKIAQTYCKEVWYECHGKTYYAIGLQNTEGGWELRNLYHKTSSSPKTYTYLNRNNATLMICEGMFDLLSLVELYPDEIEHSDIIVLNSLSFVERITSKFKNYKKVYLYLDNDQAGRRTRKALLRCYNNLSDQSFRYENYKDLNEKMVSESKLMKT